MADDKFLPDLKAAASLDDDDLMYITGPTSDDEKVTLQNTRKLMNPAEAAVAKIISHTVLVSECDGGWFSNEGAFASIEFTLPAVANNLMIGLFVATDKYIVITPQVADRIVYLTNVDGQSVRNKTIGSCLFLRATANDWYVVHATGTWTAI